MNTGKGWEGWENYWTRLRFQSRRARILQRFYY